ncbi:hypothetical protein ACOSQ2_031426 [Xanthoceras sorbifolium]
MVSYPISVPIIENVPCPDSDVLRHHENNLGPYSDPIIMDNRSKTRLQNYSLVESTHLSDLGHHAYVNMSDQRSKKLTQKESILEPSQESTLSVLSTNPLKNITTQIASNSKST